MSEMEDKLNSLTPDELNALNTDPDLLQAFKTKYGTNGHDALKQTAQQQSQAWEGPGLIDQGLGGLNQKDLDKAGEDIATSKFGQQHPILGAAAGTAVSQLQNIGGAAAGLSQIGNMGPVISGPSRQTAGQAIGAAEEAAGINTSKVPVLKEIGSDYLGLKNPTYKQYLNALNDKIQSGIQMSPQELSQHHKMLSELMSNEPSPIAKLMTGAKSPLGNGLAQAAQADTQVVQQLNNAAPGRAAGATDYAAAALREKLYKYVIGAAAAGLGKKAILDAFTHVAGRH